MIHVIAIIELQKGTREKFLCEFARLKPEVVAEEGCIDYGGAVDIEAGMGGDGQYGQLFHPDAVVVIEKWSSMETWKAHLAAPHMDTYRQRTKDYVTRRNIQVLTPVN